MSRHVIVYGQSLLKCLKRAVTINLQFHLLTFSSPVVTAEFSRFASILLAKIKGRRRKG